MLKNKKSNHVAFITTFFYCNYVAFTTVLFYKTKHNENFVHRHLQKISNLPVNRAGVRHAVETPISREKMLISNLMQSVFIRPLLVLLSTSPCWGETLLHFKSGRQTKAEELLAQEKVLIYIERDCQACHQYILDLKNCKPSTQEIVQFVSISTAVQTKEMARKLPKEFPLFIVKDQKTAKPVDATPTTKFAQAQKVGILKCDQLDLFIASNKN